MRSMLHENTRLTPTARTLWEVQEKTACVPLETASNLHTEILRRHRECLARGEERRNAVRDESALREYQKKTKAAFLKCLGGLPEGPASPVFHVTAGRDCGGFRLEKVILQPRRDTQATADIYIPAMGKEPFPAVLMTVGHDDRGKADPEYQYAAQLLAFSGFLVLVLDPVGQGERFEHYEPGLDFQPIQGCSGEHDLLHWKSMLMGLPLARWFVQEGICALDYLAARPDVDEKRIAVTGHSGGGALCAMLMLAAGERLAAAAPCAYITDNLAMMENGIDPDDEMIWPGSIAEGLDYVDLAAGMAPKPVIFLTNRHDFFPREGTLRTLEAARRLWAAAGGGQYPEIAAAESQHAYPHSLARAMAAFFVRRLTGREPDTDRFTFQPLTESELQCTQSGSLLREYSGMRTLQDEFREELAVCEKAREPVAAESLRSWLNEVLHTGRVTETPDARVFQEGICCPVQYRSVIWRSEEGMWDVGVFLRDMLQGDKPLPTVVALWPEGTSRLTDHSRWIHTVLAKGWQILVPDVAASGSLLPAGLGKTSMYVGWSVLYNLTAYLIQLGDSLLALRTRQVLSALKLARNFRESDGSVLLAGWGEFSRYADLAALIADMPVCSDEDCENWGDIVLRKYHDQTHTHEWIFPGVLRHLDTPDLNRLLRRRTESEAFL